MDVPEVVDVAVVKDKMRNKKISILIFFVGVIFLITAFLTKGFGLIKSTSYPIEDDFISISLSEITNKAKWYENDLNGEKVKFFVVKTSDGSIKTAFDACDVCWRYKKGYRQEGNYMVCNNCGNRYLINSLGIENKNPGGCWPGYLPHLVEGDKIFIKKTDLENNQWRSS